MFRETPVNRDDFRKPTKTNLAQRVAYVCSNPGCLCPTIGPSQTGDGTIIIGVAAHITAAAQGGPRYDPSLTPEQRRHQSNGIWLCEKDGKLVDSDEKHFTVEMLRDWKKAAESRAFQRVAAPNSTRSRYRDVEALDGDEQAQVDQLHLPAQDDLQSVFARCLAAAKSDLLAFKNQPGWPTTAIALDLKFADGESVTLLNAPGIAAAIQTFHEIVVIAPPGTGKTTTLIQVADAILAEGAFAAAFVPLSEWSSRSDSFFQCLARRQGYRTITEQHLALLAIHGRLILVLDGWNELDTESRKRANAEIKSLRRDFPRIAIIVSTRRQALGVPVSGPIVEIAPLKRSQQLEIARATRGPSADISLRHAWQTPGVHDLVAIPLYLTAWLALTADGSIPTTKEEVLRQFVTQHEQIPERAEVLRDKLFGFHPQFLGALAVEATAAANTLIDDGKARSVIKSVEDRLSADGQITVAPQPMAVLDILVSQHSLVRWDGNAAGVSFQHQQFQEWYASLEVESLMRRGAAGDHEACRKLREDVLNVSTWEESILFACERASRADQSGSNAVSAAILQVLGIDPMLAAMMIRRSSSGVWDSISTASQRFAAEWRQSGDIARAFRFMVGTSRPEFAEQVWQTIRCKEGYDRGANFDIGWLSVSALGPNARTEYANLPEDQRRSLLWDLTRYGSQEGIDFAVESCRSEPSADIVLTILDLLGFSGAEPEHAALLESVSPDVWRLLATRHSLHYATGDFRARLIDEKKKFAALVEGAEKVRILLQLAEAGEYDNPREIIDLALGIKQWGYDAEHTTFASLASTSSDQLSTCIVERLLRGESLPHFAARFVGEAAAEQQESLRSIAVANGTSDRWAKEIAARALNLGSVQILVADLFAVLDELARNPRSAPDSVRQKYQAITDALHLINRKVLVSTILSNHPSEPHHIEGLAYLLLRWRSDDRQNDSLPVDESTRARLSAVLDQWADQLIGNSNATREQFSHLASAIKRIAAPILLPTLKRLLDADLAGWLRDRAELERIRKEGKPTTRINVGYNLIYRQAIDAFQGDAVREMLLTYIGNPDFETEAAFVLRQYGTIDSIPSAIEGIGRPKYEQILLARKRRASQQRPVSTVASVVLDRIDELLKTQRPEDFGRAIGLATAAAQMDYGDRIATINAVVSAPGQIAPRYGLILVLAFAGEIVPASYVQQGFDEALSSYTAQKWHGQNEWWAIERWIELMAFSDAPEAITACVEKLPPEFKHAHNFDRIVFALGHIDPGRALPVLTALADQISGLTATHDFSSAFVMIGSLEAARYILSLACSPQTGRTQHRDWFGMANVLSVLLDKQPDVRRELLTRITTESGLAELPVIAHVLPSIVTERDIIALIQVWDPHDNDRSSHILLRAVHDMAVKDRPIEGSNAFEREPSDLSTLRSELFQLYAAGGARGEFAAKLLRTIDTQRDTYGRPLSEPRHPNLALGIPWPPEAAIVHRPVGAQVAVE